MSPKSVEAAEATKAGPAKVTKATPAKVTEATPAKVTKATPAKVTKATPAKVTEATPAKETEATSSKGTKGTKATPAKATEVAPAKAPKAVPAKVAKAAPAKTAKTTSSKGTKGTKATPAKATEATPANKPKSAYRRGENYDDEAKAIEKAAKDRVRAELAKQGDALTKVLKGIQLRHPGAEGWDAGGSGEMRMARLLETASLLVIDQTIDLGGPTMIIEPEDTPLLNARKEHRKQVKQLSNVLKGSGIEAQIPKGVLEARGVKTKAYEGWEKDGAGESRVAKLCAAATGWIKHQKAKLEGNDEEDDEEDSGDDSEESDDGKGSGANESDEEHNSSEEDDSEEEHSEEEHSEVEDD